MESTSGQNGAIEEPATIDQLSIIVAMTYDLVIGKNGKIPWHIRDDMRLFRQATLGKTVMMGRATYESIGHPLECRNNIVVSSTMPKTEGIIVARNLEDALDKAQYFCTPIYCIGGARLYEQTLPLARHLIVSYVKQPYEGDTFFPDFELEDYLVEEYKDYQDFDFMRYRKRV